MVSTLLRSGFVGSFALLFPYSFFLANLDESCPVALCCSLSCCLQALVGLALRVAWVSISIGLQAELSSVCYHRFFCDAIQFLTVSTIGAEPVADLDVQRGVGVADDVCRLTISSFAIPCQPPPYRHPPLS